MSKKAKSRRKDAYKTFLAGLTNHRNQFIEKKFVLAEKVLADSTLKDKIESKGNNMSILERAVISMIGSRELSSVEQLQEIAEEVKEAQMKSAKFKYTPKKI